MLSDDWRMNRDANEEVLEIMNNVMLHLIGMAKVRGIKRMHGG